jgi:hypothetical protein
MAKGESGQPLNVPEINESWSDPHDDKINVKYKYACVQIFTSKFSVFKIFFDFWNLILFKMSPKIQFLPHSKHILSPLRIFISKGSLREKIADSFNKHSPYVTCKDFVCSIKWDHEPDTLFDGSVKRSILRSKEHTLGDTIRNRLCDILRKH